LATKSTKKIEKRELQDVIIVRAKRHANEGASRGRSVIRAFVFFDFFS